MDKNKITKFPKKHPIIFHLLLILVTFLVILYAVLFGVDSFTGHGIYATVPNVKGMTLQEAVSVLEKSDFKWEIADSTYSDSHKPGSIIEQEPKAESNVKPLRTVYLIINATSPRMVTMPKIVDMSYRQGMAMLQGVGFKNIKVETVYSPYKELILDVKVNGRSVESGARFPVDSQVEIHIGNGFEEALPDSLTENADSLLMLME